MLKRPFDLLQFQAEAREACAPSELYKLWDEVCTLRFHQRLNDYEYEEMRTAILPKLESISNLQKQIDETKHVVLPSDLATLDY